MAKHAEMRALAYQDQLLENDGSASFFVYSLDENNELEGFHQFGYEEELPIAIFRLLRSRATNSSYCVWRMYSMIKHTIEGTDLAHLIPKVRNQLFAEYGVDPVECKNHEQTGEITEEVFMRLRQSLSVGQEEARLLQAQPSPSKALKKQNNAIESVSRATGRSIQYIIFDPVHGDAAMEAHGILDLEVFKILRKRATISPCCLSAIYENIEHSVVDTGADPTRKRRLRDLLRKQLQAEHGRDPCSEGCCQHDGEVDDVCRDVAKYARQTASVWFHD